MMALLLCGRLVVSGEPSHPVHFTTTTIEYSQTAKSVTITIEAYGEDFQHAVKQHAGRSVNLHGAASGKGSTEVMTYLNEKFVLKDRAGRGVALTLAKLEKQDDWFFVHLKGKMPAGLAGAQLRNLLLFELEEEEHVNNVITKYQGKEIKLAFYAKDDFKVLTERPASN
jgi:lipid-binding SYLF domain-containing protein